MPIKCNSFFCLSANKPSVTLIYKNKEKTDIC